MTRREFIGKVSGIVAAIPVVGWMLGNTVETTAAVEEVSSKGGIIEGWRFLDSVKINKVVREKFNNTHDNLPFFSRTPVVNCVDDVEILAYGGYVSKGYSSDIISENGTLDVVETGAFSLNDMTIPNIKMGTKVSDSTINRAARVHNEIDKTASLKMLTDYEDTLANNLALGIKQTINAQIMQVMLGGEPVVPGRVKVQLNIPDGLHVKGDWSKPLTAIKTHRENMQTKFGETPNRITLATSAYKNIINSEEFQQEFAKFRKDNITRFEEYISGYRSRNKDVEPNENNILLYFAPTVLYNSTKVNVDLYDGVYRMKDNSGSSKAIRVLPENKILFSNSNYDNDKYILDYAQGIVVESIVADLIAPSKGIASEAFGPIAYYTGNNNLNPPDIRAWAVTRGLPRLHNRTAFSSLTIGE